MVNLRRVGVPGESDFERALNLGLRGDFSWLAEILRSEADLSWYDRQQLANYIEARFKRARGRPRNDDRTFLEFSMTPSQRAAAEVEASRPAGGFRRGERKAAVEAVAREHSLTVEQIEAELRRAKKRI